MENNKAELPILPLRDPEVVIFPEQYCEIEVGRSFSVQAVNKVKNGGKILVAIQRTKDVEEPTNKDFYTTCCECEIIKIIARENDKMSILIRGLRRAHLKKVGAPDQNIPYYYGSVEFPEFKTFTLDDEHKDKIRQLREIIFEHIHEIHIEERNPDTALKLSMFVDNIAFQLPINGRGRLKLLRELDTTKRLDAVLKIIMELARQEGIDISDDGEISTSPHEPLISDVQRLSELIENSGLIGEDLNHLRREFRRLHHIPTSSAEFQVAFNYIESVASLPWNKSTDDEIDVEKARKILDEDQFGLQKVKEHILEFLAVKKLVPNKKGNILCLVGSSGTGKTAISKSIARAMNRKFVRLALGGVSDEAEIRGHRRTYVGAMPGKIIQMLKKAGCNNPVFALDEIDKLCQNLRGDPAGALLEVLDPEQNDTFTDNYIGIPFDLSKVLFIGTVNNQHAIPHALRDRLEIVEVPSYSSFDKVRIARSYLIPKQMKENGLDCDIEFTEEAVSKIVEEYTYEGGVRQLERNCSKIIRKIAVNYVSGKDCPTIIDENMIGEYLGAQKIHNDNFLDKPTIGVSTGLTWSWYGGNILFIETCLMAGSGKIEITGNVGKVMNESAKMVKSWIKAHSADLGIDADILDKQDIHIHFPSGAVQKEGPSAGIGICASMVSAFLNKPVRNDIAVTGEISLRGRILPIGGLVEKILGAHRAGIRRVLYPVQNQADLQDLPKEILSDMELTPISDLMETLSILVINNETTPQDIKEETLTN